MWGEIDAAYYGHSNDANIRRIASSGGILTELVRYLLHKKLVDEVLTVEVPDEEGTTTRPTRLRRPDDAYRCVGSKYTASKTLYGFLDAMELGKRYAIVGRPCEVRTLRAYLSTNIPECEVVYLSFFCGGTPSKQANDKLLEVMGVGKGELESLSYRGNGWPGKTRVRTKSGRHVEMDYETSWGEILGRDLQPVCRYCWEGTGEAADIVCGDGWYLVDGKPSFEERPGRNIILARSHKGNKLLMDMEDEGLISLELIDDISVLDRMQPGQYS
ncbi:TPA: Coenzyme F420 hydrogenase/dehydrogenase, beta subunit C-terminal domain, partial [Clostridioides difficile]|nr:Coenzyme F420 hydrogenase/dehydrogenase, beta subunit C-terminal domain [Clostridioides difficile]